MAGADSGAYESGSAIAFGAAFLLQAAFRMPTEPGNLQRLHAAFAHADRLGRVGRHRLRRVRRHDHRDAAFAVHAEERMQEILRRNRIELGGRFVKSSMRGCRTSADARLSSCFWPPDKRAVLLPRTRLDAEKVRNLCHPGGAWRRPASLSFQGRTPARAIPPVTDDLAFGTLGHEAYQQAKPVVLVTSADSVFRPPPSAKSAWPNALTLPVRAPTGAISGFALRKSVLFPDPVAPTSSTNAPSCTVQSTTAQHRFVRARVAKVKSRKRQRLHLSASSPWTMERIQQEHRPHTIAPPRAQRGQRRIEAVLRDCCPRHCDSHHRQDRKHADQRHVMRREAAAPVSRAPLPSPPSARTHGVSGLQGIFHAPFHEHGRLAKARLEALRARC